MRERSALLLVLSVSVAILVLVGSAQAADPPPRFRAGASAALGWMEQNELNDTFDSFWGMANDCDHCSREKLDGGHAFSAFAEYQISRSWVVGAEFLAVSCSGGSNSDLLWHNNTEYLLYETDSDYDTGARALSAYAVYRIPLGASPLSLRLGAGVGYVFTGEFKLGYSTYQESGEWTAAASRGDTVEMHTSIVASGSSLATQAFLGAEYQVSEHLFLSADLAYRVAAIDELEVDSVKNTVNGTPVESYWGVRKGGTLKWYSGDGGDFFTTELRGDEVGLDFSGLYLTLRLMLAF